MGVEMDRKDYWWTVCKIVQSPWYKDRPLYGWLRGVKLVACNTIPLQGLHVKHGTTWCYCEKSRIPWLNLQSDIEARILTRLILISIFLCAIVIIGGIYDLDTFPKSLYCGRTEGVKCITLHKCQKRFKTYFFLSLFLWKRKGRTLQLVYTILQECSYYHYA